MRKNEINLTEVNFVLFLEYSYREQAIFHNELLQQGHLSSATEVKAVFKTDSQFHARLLFQDFQSVYFPTAHLLFDLLLI